MTIINLADAYGKPLHQMNPEMVRMTEDGHTDMGAFHRAIAIARDLCRMGVWDGQVAIRIADPYKIYNALDCWVTITFEEEYGELVARWTEPLFRRGIDDPQSAMDTSAEDEAWKASAAAQRLDAYPPSHPGFQRLLKSIEQHDPLTHEEATIEAALDEILDDDSSSSEWTEPATIEWLSSQPSDSRDLEDFFDEDDYEDDEDLEGDFGVCRNCAAEGRLFLDSPFCETCYVEIDGEDDDQDFDYTDKIYHGLDD